MLMLPEIILIITAFIVLLIDLVIDERHRTFIAPLTLIGIGLSCAVLIGTPQAGEMFGGRFAMDSVAWWFKLLFLIAAFITVAISIDLMDNRGLSSSMLSLPSRGEYYTILLFTVVGMMYLISARDIITLYVSLELSTIPLFALAAWRRDSRSGEAGLKYMITGALSSGLLLYGLSILFGITGETSLAGISKALEVSPAFWLAMAMLMAGVGFKMTIAPFHMWAAEVYQGAPTPVTAYLSVASKGAGLALMFQLLYRTLGSSVNEWSVMVAILAAITMTLGNVIAIVQQNIMRFMAFSAISQAGYLIMGFLGPLGEGTPAMIYYMLVYIVTNLAVFAVIMLHTNQTGQEDIRDYKGLSLTNPTIALGMMIALFGLAGIPPLSGFVGKFFLFSVASKAGYHWLVALAAINSTISLYYYLRIIREMYIEPPQEGTAPLSVTPILSATIATTVIASILLGIIPFFYQTIHHQTLGWIQPILK
jgi:NADH-quinone oxidoreductase subunit N